MTTQVATTAMEPCRISGFPGLYCTPDGRVNVIGFTDQRMSDVFPTSVLAFTRIRVLFLVNAGFKASQFPLKSNYNLRFFFSFS
jgi:hypothetical protein